MTRVVFIAAGMGRRLSPYTDNLPKCMLPINQKPLLHHNIEKFLNCGINHLSAVVGYEKDKVKHPELNFFENKNYTENNILFSLMYAEKVFDECIKEQEDLIISYSDIIYDQRVVDNLLIDNSPLAIVCDKAWEKIYVGRKDHPISQAELATVDEQGWAARLGKGLEKESRTYEFIGLLKLNHKGCLWWKETFKKLKQELGGLGEIRTGVEFHQASLTDFINKLIEENFPVKTVLINGGWREIDTEEDYLRLQTTDLHSIDRGQDEHGPN